MIKIPQVFFWKFIVAEINLYKNLLFCDIHEGVYLQHPVPWISDNNSALLHAHFEKSQTKRTTFLWKKSSPTHESPFNFKNWWLNFSPTKIFPDIFSPGKVYKTELFAESSILDVWPGPEYAFEYSSWSLLLPGETVTVYQIYTK